MSLISSSIPNLVNGVSQQPYTLRLSSQGEAQVNGWSTISKGLKKRPATEFIANLGTPLSSPSDFFHFIKRDEVEQYVVKFNTSSGVEVWDLQGNKKVVNGTFDYLNCNNPQADLKALTVADYTFIVNKTKVVEASTSTSPAKPQEALIYVFAGNYGKSYKVFFNGVEKANFTTRDGSVAAHVIDIDTDYIASQLTTTLTSAPEVQQVTRKGSVIYIQFKDTAGNVDVTTQDGFNGGAMRAIKDYVQSFSDLPANCAKDGYKVQIAGDPNSGQDNYWMQYNSGGGDNGFWEECIAPATPLGLQDSTMPHVLIREADGTFTFAPAQWALRDAGDEETNPDPTFTGQQIRDVFFFRNRLGFLSRDSVVMSQAGEYFNFYRTTVTELLDSNVIDVVVSHTKVAELSFAIPFNKELLLFSSQTQFVIESVDLLTPKTIAVKQSTEFECSRRVEPVAVGKNIYFVSPRGTFSAIREYFVDSDIGGNDSTEVTGHVPNYVPSGIYNITAGLNEDVLVFLSDREPQSLFIYKYYWAGNEKLQSSWSKWTFPNWQVRKVFFIESTLYLAIQTPHGLTLQKMELSERDLNAAEPYDVHLDQRWITNPEQNNLSAEKVYLNVPFTIDSTGFVAVVAKGQPNEGEIIPLYKDSNGTFVGGAAYASTRFVIGRKYEFLYTMSPITIKVQAGSSQRSENIGRLQLRNLSVNFADTGYFKAVVETDGRSPFEYAFTGKILGTPSATIGTVKIQTGNFRFPIMARNLGCKISFKSDNPLPLSILSIDWEGFYVRRSRGV